MARKNIAPVFRRKTTDSGFTIVEVLAGLFVTTLLVSMSVTPILQMNSLEKKVESQSALDIAHQLALQKSRNADFLKSKLGLAAGNEIDNCFGGRGINCQSFEKSLKIDTNQTSDPKNAPTLVSSTTSASIKCESFRCSEVTITVSTSQQSSLGSASSSNWNLRPLVSSFQVPAVALSSRREIDFSKCAGKAVTGVDFNTLTAQCDGFVGNNTCSGISNAGPMATFGQPTSSSNCQPPVDSSCGTGMATFGMISGQAKCASKIKCSDPLSSACQAGAGPSGNPPPAHPPTDPSCKPNWQPSTNNICSGTEFTQIDANNCSGSVPQKAIGTNANLCPVKICSSKGTIKWPDPNLGPCESSAVLTSSPGQKTSTLNQKAGYFGTFSPNCRSDGTFDMATALKDCKPITCTGIPLNLSWSNKGMKSATGGSKIDTSGPWDCSGPVSFSGSGGQGTLVNTVAEPTAKAFASNTAGTASSGSLTLTCSDPGPTQNARTGTLNVIGVNCSPKPPEKLITLPIRGQHCDIGGPWGWRWFGSQMCPAGSAMVSNKTEACPAGSVSYGDGCYTPNSSDLGKQLCPGADQADECCFYPCQAGGVQPPINCKESTRTGFFMNQTACWKGVSVTVPRSWGGGEPTYRTDWFPVVTAQCTFLDTSWWVNRNEWGVYNGYSPTQMYRDDANVTYAPPFCHVTGCNKMVHSWRNGDVCQSDQVLTCRRKDGETYTEIRKNPIPYPESESYGICPERQGN